MSADGPPVAKPMEHISELGYTNDDDGVWLSCTNCLMADRRISDWHEPWSVCLGFFPTIEDVVAAWAAHTATKAAPATSTKEDL